MWDEVRTVFWLEYRRHVRSRLFWRLLLLIGGISLGGSAGCALLMSQLNPSSGTSNLVGTLAMGLLSVLGGVAMVAPALVVPRIFSDLYKTRELHDIYLTALHPVGIVAGRMLTASVQVGLVLLTLFPAGMLICQIAGFHASYWVSMLVLTWGALLVIIGLCVQGLGKRFPADVEGALVGASSKSGEVVLWLFFLSLFPLLSRWLPGADAHLPIYLALPLLVPYEALARCSLGSWELPLWALALPMMVGIVALAIVATAQWLGWWSDVAYRCQRLGGTVLFLLIYALNLAPYAQRTVNSIGDAERVVFWGVSAGAIAYLAMFARMLGYYGMGVRPRTTRYALAPPLGGIVWEWILIAAIALMAWLTVGWTTGYWVNPSRWLAWSGCMLSLLLLAQALHSQALTFWWLWFRQPPTAYHVNRSEARAYFESVGFRIASNCFGWLFVLRLLGWFLSLIPLPLLKTIGSWLVVVNPLSGLSPFTPDLTHYVRYMGYTLLLALGFTLYGIYRGRALFTQSQHEKEGSSAPSTERYPR